MNRCICRAAVLLTAFVMCVPALAPRAAVAQDGLTTLETKAHRELNDYLVNLRDGRSRWMPRRDTRIGVWLRAAGMLETAPPYVLTPIDRTVDGTLYVDTDSDFAVCMWPVEYRPDCRRTFIADIRGNIWYKDLGEGRRLVQWPAADPAADGWTRSQMSVVVPPQAEALLEIHAAQVAWRASDMDGDGELRYRTEDIRGLHHADEHGEKARFISEGVAAADTAGDDPSPHDGYLFTMVELSADGTPYAEVADEQWAACAHPAPGRDGPTYLVDQDARLLQKDTDGAAVGRFPADPEAEGWTPVGPPPEPETPANEAAAAATLKNLVVINATWRQGDVDGNGIKDHHVEDIAGFHWTMNMAGEPVKYISRALADADATKGEDKAEPRHGYYFIAMREDENGVEYTRRSDVAFAFCAYPAEYGVTGKLTFMVNEMGVVYAKDIGGEPVWMWPAEDPTTQGWVPVE